MQTGLDLLCQLGQQLRVLLRAQPALVRIGLLPPRERRLAGEVVSAQASERLAFSELIPDFQSRAWDLTRRPFLSHAIVDALLRGLRKAGLRTEDA